MAPLIILLSIALVGAPAAADRYNEEEAGHPVRIVAYIVHPIGVILDYLILRPGHWLVSHEPMRTLFGHED